MELDGLLAIESRDWARAAKLQMTRLSAAVVFFSAFVLAPLAVAETGLPELVHRWGLVGKWSTNCSAAKAEPHLVTSYEINPHGEVIIDNGHQLTEMRILRIDPTGDLVLQTIEATSADRRVLILRRSENTLQPVLNSKQDNDITIRNGKFVASLRETSAISRCE